MLPARDSHLLRPTLGALLACVLANHAAAATREAYEARVVAPGASVHSGPGENFYITDTLPQGDVVEVYREEPGGWLGIRPPQDSFSWLFGAHVKRLEGPLAEVDKDDVASRIGSRLSNHKNAVQVRLRKGEVVEIIGEETIEGKKWYKIAPPSGEFRWIHARNVARGDSAAPAEPADRPIVTVPLAEPIGTQQREHEPPVNLASEPPAVTLVADAQPQAGPEWRAAPADSAQQSKGSDAMAESAVSEPSATDANAPAADAVEQAPPTSATAATAAATETKQPMSQMPPDSPITPIPADDVARELTDIELRLSRTVAEAPATWRIDPLRRDAELLLSQATNDGERAAIGSTLAKLDRFAAIARQYQQVSPTIPLQTPTTPIPYSAGSGDPRTAGLPDTRQPTADTSRYDAVGVLRPVVSKRPGAPQFALVDDRGQVVSFVTPSPDVNLQPYLGHRIGVTGNRGFIPEFQRTHVTAGRVAPLGGRIVR